MYKKIFTLLVLASLVSVVFLFNFNASAILFAIVGGIVTGIVYFATENKTESSEDAHTSPRKSEKKNEELPPETPVVEEAPKKEECTENLFPSFVNDYYLKYNYTDNICLIGTTAKDAAELCGKSLTFEKEPDNQYDSNAVSISCGDIKLGYVYRGKLQGMINDWLDRDEPMSGYISEILFDENKVTYKIAFYHSLDEFKSKVYPLVRLGVDCGYRKRRDNLEELEEGDSVTTEYSSEDDEYVAYDRYGNQVGAMPSRYAADADGYEDALPGVIAEITYDDDKVSGKVRIYFKS